MKHYIALAAVAATISFSACKKHNDTPFNSNTKADLSIEFDNIAGSQDLQLNTGSYTNNSGEDFNVSKLKYYVSSFILTRTDGTVYTVPKDSCYFLIDESNEETHEPLLHVPEGEYKTLQFTLGIDSLKSISDVSERTGVLDPSGEGAEMYWGWNSGYIFFKMEGSSPASAQTGNVYMYHIGGFGGYSSPTVNNLKNYTFDLTQRGIPQVRQGKETNIHLLVDVLKLFDGASTVSIAQHPVVMFDPYSTTVADNFTGMIRHDHTEN